MMSWWVEADGDGVILEVNVDSTDLRTVAAGQGQLDLVPWGTPFPVPSPGLPNSFPRQTSLCSSSSEWNPSRRKRGIATPQAKGQPKQGRLILSCKQITLFSQITGNQESVNLHTNRGRRPLKKGRRGASVFASLPR